MELTYEDQGAGRAVLLLHGGAGPRSVLPFAQRLAGRARVIVPTHPGFDGTPAGPAGVGDLAERYLALLDELGLDRVAVIGNSIGGWIAAEMAVRDAAGATRDTETAAGGARRRLDRLVLVGAVGIAVPGHPVADFFALDFAELARRSYANPDAFRIDPAALSDAQRAVMAGNRQAIAHYSGPHAMADPGLRARLRDIAVPTVALWGEADRIVDADYGRAYAAAIPGATFVLLPGTGHIPLIETPEQVIDQLDRIL